MSFYNKNSQCHIPYKKHAGRENKSSSSIKGAFQCRHNHKSQREKRVELGLETRQHSVTLRQVG